MAEERLLQYLQTKYNELAGKDKNFYAGFCHVLSLIIDSPFASNPLVIQCKDCKYFDPECDTGEYIWWSCNKHGIEMSAEDFCSYGERKEADDGSDTT